MAKDILIVPGSSNIQFSGSAANNIKLETLDSGSVAFTSNSGSLFTVTNSLTGSLFSVGDVSGVPILDVNSDDTVTLGQFSSPIKVLTNASSHTVISGSATSTGSFGRIEGDVTIPSGKALRTSLIKGASNVEIDTEGARVVLTNSELRVGASSLADVYDNNVVIASNVPAVFFDDTDVTNLRHAIIGGGNAGLEIMADIHNATTGYIRFNVGGSVLAQLNEGGNFGIGDTSPSYKLDVAGTGRFTSNLYVGHDTSNVGLYLGNSNSRIYFGGNRALEGGSSGTMQIGEGFSTLLLQGNTTVQGNMVVTGTLTAQEFITELNTVTIIESSGSTKFGNTNDDLHQFTGSMKIQRGDDVNLTLKRGSQSVAYLGDTGSQNDGALILYDESGNQDILIRAKDATNSFINTTGNFGFGTTVPGNKVHIQETNTDDYSPTGENYANAILRLHNADTSATTPHSLIHFRLDKNGGDGYLGFITDGSTGNVEHFVLGNQVDNEILRVARGGNVGIGTTSPGYPLEVEGATGNTVAKFGQNMALHMIHNAPVIGFNLYYNSGYKFGEGSSSSYGGYLALSTGTGNFAFATSNTGNAGGAATMTERLVITNAGRVGIGTTSDIDAQLHIAGATWNNSLVIQGNSTVSGIVFEDSSANKLGYVYAADTGIGFLDDDSAWAIRHQTDSLTEFRINNTIYAQLTTTGLAIGSGHTPSYNLDVKGGSSRFIGSGNTNVVYFAGSDGDSDGAIYSDTNQFGLLDGDGAWAIRHQTDTLTEFRINNSEKMRILNSGNVGIGTASPNTNAQLHLYKAGSHHLWIDGDATGDLGLFGRHSGTAIFGIFDDHSDGKLRITNYQAEPIEFSVDRGGSETIVMTMLNSGNVGIGTTAPVGQNANGPILHLFGPNSTDEPQIVFQQTGETAMAIGVNGNIDGGSAMMFYTNGSNNRMVIHEGGNIGIGTNAADVKLHLHHSSAGSVDSYTGVHFTIEATSNAGMQFLTGANSDSRIWFGDAANTTAGGILYTHNATATAEHMELRVNAATRLKIMGTGDVGIGYNSPTNWLHLAQSTAGNHFNEGIRIVRGEFGGDSTQHAIINNYNGTLNLISRGGSNHGYINLMSSDNGSTLRTMLQIDAREDQYLTPTGSAISYNVKGASGAAHGGGVSGSYVIYRDMQVKQVVHNGNDDYQLMKTFTPSKSGNVTLQFEAYISSGTYYWAFRVGRNGDGRNDSNTGAYQSYDSHYSALHNKPFSVYLDPSNTSSVHAYRKYNVNLRFLRAGETVDLYMVSSTSGGTPQTGNGQTLYLKNFVVRSDSPSTEIVTTRNTFSNRVGIGTLTNLDTLLNIHGDGSNDYAAIHMSNTIGGNKTTTHRIEQWYGDEGTVRLYSGGSESVRIRARSGQVSFFNAGNVGIGSAAPTQALDVVGGGAFTTSVFFNGRVRINHDGQVHWGAAYNQGYLSWDTGKVYIGGLSGNATHIQSAASDAIVIDTSQNTKFINHVSIQNGKYLNFLDTGGNAHFRIFQNSSDILEINSVAYGGAVFTVDATGGGVNIPTNLDVGAGLDVTGNITVTGTVDGVDIAALSTSVSGKVSTTGNETIGGVKTFSSNITAGTGQIVTPGGTNLALNPNTGIVSVGGVIQTTGAGNNTMAGNLVVGGNITAQQFITEYQTETIIETSGSTMFGNTSDDVHQFTGSLVINGELHNSRADRTPAGVTFSNTIKAASGNNRTIYFDGDGSTVSTWYGVGNNAFAAIDCSDGQLGLWTNNSNNVWNNALVITSASVRVNGSLYFNDGNTRVHEGGGNALRITTDSGYVDIGAMNTVYCHLYTDRSGFFLDSSIYGAISLHLGGYGTEKINMSYDGNYGKIYSSGGVPLSLGSNGDNNRLVIDTSGRVGIGAVSPETNYKLTIKETSSENAVIAFTDTDDMLWGYVGPVRGTNQIVTGTANGDFVVGSAYNVDTHIVTNGSIRMTALNNGYVGIGETDPDTTLHVKGAGNTTIFQTTAAQLNLYFKDTNDNLIGQLEFLESSTGTSQLVTRNTSNLRLGTNNAGAIWISGSNQYVGIGVTSPDHPLKIRTDSSDKGIELTADGEASSNRIFSVMKDGNAGRLFLRDAGTAKIHFNAKSGEDHYINNGGNVGIGNTNPGAKLEVKQTAASPALFVDQDANSQAVWIDSEATTQVGVYIPSPKQTTSNVLAIDNANDLTLGRFMYLHSNSADTSTRNLIQVVNDNTASTGTTLLGLQQDSSNYAMFIQNPTNVTNHGNGLFIAGVDENNTSYPLFIKTNSSTLDEGAGNPRFVVRADGRIGVNTSAPTAALEIYGDGDSANQLRLRHNGSGTNGVLDLSVTDTEANIIANYSSTAIPLKFLTGAAERLRLAAGGSQLSFTNTSEGLIDRLSDGGVLKLRGGREDGYWGSAINMYGGSSGTNGGNVGAIYFYNRSDSGTFPTVTMALKPGGGSSAGLVGIGRSDPAYPLDVAGNARVTNNLYMNSYGELSWDGATGEFRVYATSGKELKLSANGHNNHITIDTTGRVGINQTSPGAVLEVKGHSSVSTTALITHGAVQFKTTENDSSELRHQFNMGGSSDAGSYVIKQGDASTNGIVLAAGDDSYIANNLGIGNASPQGQLHINGSTNGINFGMMSSWNRSFMGSNVKASSTGGRLVRIASSTLDYPVAIAFGYQDIGGFGSEDSKGGINFITVGSNLSTDIDPETYSRMYIHKDGNIGINDITPSYKLSVNGTGHFTGNLETAGTFTATTGIFHNGSSLLVRRNDGSNTRLEVSNTHTGDAFLLLDASNGDFGGADYATIFHQNSTLDLVIGTESNAGKIRLTSKGSNTMTLDGANVGIATASPGYKLDVAGDLRVTNGSGNLVRFTGAGASSFYISATGQITHTSTTGNTAFAINQAGSGDAFSVDSSALIVKADGDVGIGVSAPANLLQVGSHVHVTTAGLIGIGLAAPETDLHISNASPAIRFTDENVSNLKHQIIGGGDAGLEFSADINDVGAGYHRWDIAGSEKMRLIESGFLGIGTSNPIRMLDIVASSGDPGIRLESAAQSADVITLRNADGRIGFGMDTITVSAARDVGIGVLPNSDFKTYIYDNTNSGNAWALNVYQDGSGGNGARIDVENTDASIFAFQVGANGGSTDIFNVKANGQVGIMDTTPSYALDVTGTIRATADVIAYSDERVKDNIETIENPLDKIKELRGVSYNRNDIEDKSKKIGVIAQEVEKVLPEVVEQDDEGKYSVAYGNMVGLLIESVKEQQKQIEELKSEIQELKDGSSK